MAFVQLSPDTLTVTGIFAGPQLDNPAYALIADADPRVTAFLTPTAQMVALQQLQANDSLMFRALEVLIDVLIAKGSIVATDFSAPVRAMYIARKPLRVTAGVP